MKTGYIIFDAVQNEIIKNGNQRIASAAKTLLDLTENEKKILYDFRQNNKGWHCVEKAITVSFIVNNINERRKAQRRKKYNQYELAKLFKIKQSYVSILINIAKLPDSVLNKALSIHRFNMNTLNKFRLEAEENHWTPVEAESEFTERYCSPLLQAA